MPTVLSVTMAVGARLLAKKQAVVSRLVAIEELAGVDILCADKTGALTQNKLTLGEPFRVAGVAAAQVILYGALASRADDPGDDGRPFDQLFRPSGKPGVDPVFRLRASCGEHCDIPPAPADVCSRHVR